MAVRAPGRGGSCGGDSGDEDGLDVEHDACILPRAVIEEDDNTNEC